MGNQLPPHFLPLTVCLFSEQALIEGALSEDDSDLNDTDEVSQRYQ